MNNDHESFPKQKQNYFELPPNSEIDELLSRVEDGVEELTVLSSGVYSIVLSSSSNEGLVLKVLDDNPRVIKSLQKGSNRYGELSPWISEERLLLSFIKAENPVTYQQLTQLALQHEMHLKFLKEHVIPKKFAIVQFSKPVLGIEVTQEDFSRLRAKKSKTSQENQLITLLSGMQGKLVGFTLFGSHTKNYFQKYENGLPTEIYYEVVIEPGEHIVEIQRKIPFDGNRRIKVLSPGVLRYIESNTNGHIWNDQFIDELLHFLSNLIDMLIAGVSFDSSYKKVPEANYLVIEEDGRKRIVTYDTNNWEVSKRYRDSITKFFSGVSVSDPYPGVDHDFVDQVLSEKLIYLLLEKLSNAIADDFISDQDKILNFFKNILSKLNAVTSEADTYQAIEERNKPIHDKLENLRAILDQEYQKKDPDTLHLALLDSIYPKIIKLEDSLIPVKSIPSLMKRIENLLLIFES